MFPCQEQMIDSKICTKILMYEAGFDRLLYKYVMHGIACQNQASNRSQSGCCCPAVSQVGQDEHVVTDMHGYFVMS